MNIYCLEHFQDKIIKKQSILENFKNEISKIILPNEEQKEILGSCSAFSLFF